MVVDGGKRIRTLGRGPVGVLEVDLDELAGYEIQRLAVVAQEHVVANAGREHPA